MKTGKLVVLLTCVLGLIVITCLPLSVQGAALKFNPLQVATLRWYQGTDNGPDIAMPGGVAPWGLAFDGLYMYVTCPSNSQVYRAAASGVMAPTAFGAAWAPGEAPFKVAYDGRNIWVTNNGVSGFVRKMNIATGAILNTVPTGNNSSGIAFDGTNIWVANFGSNNISRINAKNPIAPDNFEVGYCPSGVAFDGANIWVTNNLSSNVMKLNVSTGEIMKTVTVGLIPGGLAFDGSSIWVACAGDGTPANPGRVYKIKASSGAKTKTITFANPARPLNIAFDGANIWVTLQGTNQVTKIANNGKILGTYPVGTFPYGIAFDGHNVWVANWSSHTLSIR